MGATACGCHADPLRAGCVPMQSKRAPAPAQSGVASSVGTAKVSSSTSFSAMRSALRAAFEAVAVEAGREQPGLAFLVGLIDRERCLDLDPVRFGGDDPGQTNDVPVGMDVVLVRLAQRRDAVLEHRPAVAQDQRDRQTGIVVFARHDLVAALGGEQREPVVVAAEIEQPAILREQRLHGELVRDGYRAHRAALTAPPRPARCRAARHNTTRSRAAARH